MRVEEVATRPPATHALGAAARSGLTLRARRGLRVTSEGLVFLLVTLGVGLAAVNTGNNLVYLVLGLLLGLILLSGVLSDLVLARVRVERRLPRRAVVGVPCLVELELENAKAWLPSFSIAARDVTTEGSHAPRSAAHTRARSAYFLKLDPRGRERGGYLCTPTRRGWLAFERVELSTRYPFGFFDKWRALSREGALLVHPGVVSVPDLEGRLAAQLGREDALREASRRRVAQGAELASLRPFRDGDDARAIHFRRSAALGTWVMREREHEPARRIALRLGLEGGDAPHAERLERIVARAASIARIAHERGAFVELLAPGERFGPLAPDAALEPLLDFLALLAPGLDAEIPPPSGGGEVLDVGDVEAGRP